VAKVVRDVKLATGKLAPGWPVDVEDGLAALGRGFNNRPQGQRSDQGVDRNR
jgi:hypothetical protein